MTKEYKNTVVIAPDGTQYEMNSLEHERWAYNKFKDEPGFAKHAKEFVMDRGRAFPNEADLMMAAKDFAVNALGYVIYYRLGTNTHILAQMADRYPYTWQMTKIQYDIMKKHWEFDADFYLNGLENVTKEILILRSI